MLFSEMDNDFFVLLVESFFGYSNEISSEILLLIKLGCMILH